MCLDVASFDDVVTLTGELLASLDEDERGEVYGENAQRVYGFARA